MNRKNIGARTVPLMLVLTALAGGACMSDEMIAEKQDRLIVQDLTLGTDPDCDSRVDASHSRIVNAKMNEGRVSRVLEADMKYTSFCMRSPEFRACTSGNLHYTSEDSYVIVRIYDGEVDALSAADRGPDPCIYDGTTSVRLDLSSLRNEFQLRNAADEPAHWQGQDDIEEPVDPTPGLLDADTLKSVVADPIANTLFYSDDSAAYEAIWLDGGSYTGTRRASARQVKSRMGEDIESIMNEGYGNGASFNPAGDETKLKLFGMTPDENEEIIDALIAGPDGRGEPLEREEVLLPLLNHLEYLRVYRVGPASASRNLYPSRDEMGLFGYLVLGKSLDGQLVGVMIRSSIGLHHRHGCLRLITPWQEAVDHFGSKPGLGALRGTEARFFDV